MALRSAAARLLPPVSAQAPIWYCTKRFMVLDGLKGYGDRESAQENVYIKREEELALRKLLSKIKKQSDEAASEALLKKQKQEEIAGIKVLVDKYNLSPADVDALLDWKHHHH